MIKIFLSVRNRLAITKKCIQALKKHSSLSHQIYVYDNLSNYKVKEHHEYWYNLLKNNLITQITYNTRESTFNAFSKAVSSNQFGYSHLLDPRRDEYDFLVILDNDIIVFPGWDELVLKTWTMLQKNRFNNIQIVSQIPGGIVKRKELNFKVDGRTIQSGKLGGSGFWCLKNSFFKDVGFLDIKPLIGHNKKHDSSYWNLLEKASKGEDYIVGIGGDPPLCIHCGGLSGSICNELVKTKKNIDKNEAISFKSAEEKIENIKFDEFIKVITEEKRLRNDW